MTKKNQWICEQERVLIHSPVLDVIEQDCRSTENAEHKHRFYVLRARDWCNIIPVTEDGKIVMVRQYRIGINQDTIEIPGGVTDPGEDLQATAIREMIEETGYVPLPHARCEKVDWTYPNPAIQNNVCHSFIVGPVRRERDQKLDPGEMIDVVEVPIEEAIQWVAEGSMKHALIIHAFLMIAVRSEAGQKALAQTLMSYTKSGSGSAPR